MTAPDWLRLHGGDLKLGSDGATWYVLLGADPHYAISAIPTAGTFCPFVKQTINGQRIPSQGTTATPEEALRTGLEDLRKAMGW